MRSGGAVVLETPRLIRREQTTEDLDAVAAMAADPDVMRYLGTGGVRDRDLTEEALAWKIERSTADGFGLWTTVERDTWPLTVAMYAVAAQPV